MSAVRVSKIIASPDGEQVTIYLDNGQAVGCHLAAGISADTIATSLSRLANEVQAAASLPVRPGISDEYARATYVDFSAMIRDTLPPLQFPCRGRSAED